MQRSGVELAIFRAQVRPTDLDLDCDTTKALA